MDARARSDWSGVDPVIAARLARCQAELEREQRKKTGQDLDLIEQLSRRELALRRALKLGSADRSADAAARRMLERAAEDATRDDDPDGLLAWTAAPMTCPTAAIGCRRAR